MKKIILKLYSFTKHSIFVLFLIFFVFFLVGNYLCSNNLQKELKSPNGKYTAYAFIRDGGATTSYSPQVSLIRNVNKFTKNTMGNIFTGYRSEYIDIRWEDDSTLTILYDCDDKEIRKKVSEFNGIKIKYEKRDHSSNYHTQKSYPLMFADKRIAFH